MKKNVMLAKHLRRRASGGTPPGVSLLIAIIFITALMYVSADLAQSTIHAARNRKDADMAGKIFYFAEGALEMAQYWASSRGLGANSDANDTNFQAFTANLFEAAREIGINNCADIDSSLFTTTPCVSLRIVGRAETAEQQVYLLGEKFFSVPVRGTGDAGKECDPQAAPSNLGAGDSGPNPKDADAPCNWNKIFVGQTAEVPLYYEDDFNGDGMPDASAHDFNSGDAKFLLRVRAPKCADVRVLPCNDVSGTERVTLYPPEGTLTGSPDFRDPKKDPVLLQWLVYDKEDAGGTSLVARDEVVTKPFAPDIGKRPIKKDEAFDNSEISAGRINMAKDPKTVLPGAAQPDTLENLVVLKYDSSSLDNLNKLDKHIGENLNDKEQPIGEYIANLSFPIFRISLVDQPQRDDGDADPDDQSPGDPKYDEWRYNIPYLEYQILSKNVQISDTKSFIYASADIGDFSKTFTAVQKRPVTSGGFAIENF